MLQAGASFLSPEPQVVLIDAFRRPFDTAVAAARTCYSARGIIRPEEVAGDDAPDDEARERARARRDALAASIFRAGHHTVFQHAHLQFALSNVSRHFVWSFLHAHPFYNSEQVSQRYVAVKPGNYAIPPLAGEALAVYEATIAAQFAAYEELGRMLLPATEAAYFRRFPGRRHQAPRWQGEIEKRALEVARYILPIATFTALYHTISALTLLRYHRVSQLFDVPLEQRIVVGKMVDCLLAAAPEFAPLLGEPVAPEETAEYSILAEPGGDPRAFRDEFDTSLEGHRSRLVDWKAGNEAILAQSVREVLGLPRTRLSDEEAIRMALDSGRNPMLAQTLNLTMHGKLTRCLVHPSYTFRKRLSHTADSQDQRHRLTPASRPVLQAHVDGQPDVIVPDLIASDPACARRYADAVERSWEGVTRLRSLGVAPEFALYLLPNGVAVRFTESADLLGLRHKLAMRLCYNAQEEIWRVALDEARQIREVNPVIGSYLFPPCRLREMAGITPPCPEGKRFCGARVWKLDLDAYQRDI
ncbi:MAG: FAD-dependent thymidylate synthase [Armatimonadetes bacterium]|jgi:thymidylate synthase ThyX|nr:FAD-dependent thymidylate synthase [Armatimonadota bacterium]